MVNIVKGVTHDSFHEVKEFREAPLGLSVK